MAWGPLIRIVLRYLAGILVAKGVLTGGGAAEEVFLDDNVISSLEVLAGAAIAVVNEVWYGVAKKTGGDT